MKTYIIELTDPFGGQANTEWSMTIDGEKIEGKVCAYNYSSCGVHGPGVLNVCRLIEPTEHTQGNMHTYWTGFIVQHCDIHINASLTLEERESVPEQEAPLPAYEPLRAYAPEK